MVLVKAGSSWSMVLFRMKRTSYQFRKIVAFTTFAGNVGVSAWMFSALFCAGTSNHLRYWCTSRLGQVADLKCKLLDCGCCVSRWAKANRQIVCAQGALFLRIPGPSATSTSTAYELTTTIWPASSSVMLTVSETLVGKAGSIIVTVTVAHFHKSRMALFGLLGSEDSSSCSTYPKVSSCRACRRGRACIAWAASSAHGMLHAGKEGIMTYLEIHGVCPKSADFGRKP